MLAKGAIHDEVEWRHSRNYFHRLFSVEGAKLAMARRYLEATTTSSPASGNGNGHVIPIDELTRGYRWVEAHLANKDINGAVGVASTSTTAENGRLKRTRYQYRPEPVVDYANSGEFAQVVEKLAVDAARQQLIRWAFKILKSRNL